MIFPTVVFHAADAKAINKKKFGGKIWTMDWLYVWRSKNWKSQVSESKSTWIFSMNLDYTTKGEVKFDMQKYEKNMIDEFTIRIGKS